jgi:hypothetical protein
MRVMSLGSKPGKESGEVGSKISECDETGACPTYKDRPAGLCQLHERFW